MNDESTARSDVTRLVSGEAAEALRQSDEGRLRASLVVIAGDEIGREYPIDGARALIGRGEDAEVHVPSRSVSRRHAEIIRTEAQGDEEYNLRDLGSTNGTLLNNNRVEETRLHNGDKIQTGDVVLKFVLQDALEARFSREVHRLIHFDQLTGLMTMASFRRVLEDAIRFARDGETFALAMTDLDGLKRVNDTYGHLAGRKTVETMGAVMRDVLRSGDRAGLYGGDEAVVLFPSSSVEEAAVVAEELRTRIASLELERDGERFGVTISQGLAEWPRHGRTAEALIAAADRALYQAKADGRNRVRIASA